MKLLSILLVKLIFWKERSLFAKKTYNFFLRGWIIPANWSHISTCTTKEAGEKYDFIMRTYISNYFIFSSSIVQISHIVYVSPKVFKKWFKQVDKMFEK